MPERICATLTRRSDCSQYAHCCWLHVVACVMSMTDNARERISMAWACNTAVQPSGFSSDSFSKVSEQSVGGASAAGSMQHSGEDSASWNHRLVRSRADVIEGLSGGVRHFF